MKTIMVRLCVILLASVLFFVSFLSIDTNASNVDEVAESNVSLTTENLQPGFSVVDTSEGRVIVEVTSEGDIIVSKANPFRVTVARWEKNWNYTHIAVTKGVLANAINHALYSGIGATLSPLVPIPSWAIQALLNGAGWTKRGSAPGEAVANLWDKNKNGWVGFYFQRGYGPSGEVVATRYSTR